MRLAWLVAAGLLGAPGCAVDLDAGSQARTIVNGTATTGFPTTGILLTGSNPATLICSGTLVGCDVFLTAAHCVCFGSGSQCQDTTPDEVLRVYLQNVGFVPVIRRHVHPDFEFPDADVAVLELARPVTGVTPTPLQAAAVPLGTTGTIVGYGRSGGNLDDYGIKQAGEVVTGACPADASGPGHVCWTYSGEGSNTCNGDSGGPLFVAAGGELAVAGITSGGTRASCLEGDRSYDNDVFSVRDYIADAAGADRLGQATCGDLPQVGQDGTTVTSQQGRLARGEIAAVEIDVPRGTSELRVTLNATEGADMDVRVRQGEPPTATESDCAGVGPSSYAACAIEAPGAGAWHAAVDARDDGDYQLTVTMLGGAPVAIDDAYAATADSSLEVAAAGGVLANDEPSARGPLSAEIEGQPAHGTVELAADGGFRYTPAAGWVGADSFTYRATDGTQAGSATVALTVTADQDGDGDEGGCGCRTAATSGTAAGHLLLALAAVLALRRRHGPRLR
ncbi:MAG TPA: trypsin-like serine protease [Kofleriaceae bacterium]|nr:trypsin-like serine protease [Kofleriaceae bacterium]